MIKTDFKQCKHAYAYGEKAISSIDNGTIYNERLGEATAARKCIDFLFQLLTTDGRQLSQDWRDRNVRPNNHQDLMTAHLLEG